MFKNPQGNDGPLIYIMKMACLMFGTLTFCTTTAKVFVSEKPIWLRVVLFLLLNLPAFVLFPLILKPLFAEWKTRREQQKRHKDADDIFK